MKIMKKIICLFFVIAMLFGCSADTNTEIEKNETEQTENEISSTASETEEEEIPFVSVAEDIEFWSKYWENYTRCTYDWIDDNYFFILLENKDGENFRYIFWDAENEKLTDLGEHETEIFLEKRKFFSRNGNFYMITSPNKIMQIELESFEISYIDINISERYIEKEWCRIISLSPCGIVAELEDEYTLLIYDIFEQEQKTTVDLKKVAPLGMLLNQGIEWSFDGKYFSLFVYEEGKEYHQDSTYAIFNSEGNFIRNITGCDRGVWDTDRVWTWSYSDENKENYYIYSLSEPHSEPIIVPNFYNSFYGLRPRNGICYYEETSDESGSKLVKVDSLNDAVRYFAEFDIDEFSSIPCPSVGGKNIALPDAADYNGNEFFFKFLELY